MGKSVTLIVDVTVVLGWFAKLVASLCLGIITITDSLCALTPKFALIKNLSHWTFRDCCRAAVVVGIVYLALFAEIVAPLRLTVVFLK